MKSIFVFYFYLYTWISVLFLFYVLVLFFLFLFSVQGLNKGETLEASDHGSNHAFARRGSVARLIAPIRAQSSAGSAQRGLSPALAHTSEGSTCSRNIICVSSTLCRFTGGPSCLPFVWQCSLRLQLLLWCRQCSLQLLVWLVENLNNEKNKQ